MDILHLSQFFKRRSVALLVFFAMSAYSKLPLAIGLMPYEQIVLSLERGAEHGREMETIVSSIMVRFPEERMQRLINALWLENREEFPSFDWEGISKPNIKIYVARMYLVLHERDLSDRELKKVRSYIRIYSKSDSSELRRIAYGSAEAFGRSDENTILKCARSDVSSEVRESCVFLLYAIFHKDAKPMLKDLFRDEKNSSVQKVIGSFIRLTEQKK